MRRQIETSRITKDALMLTLLCVIGMFSINIGELKFSLQLLVVYIICLLSDKALDSIIVTLLYLLIGLFLPVYAGFNSSFSSPTFGYIISFVVISPIIFYMNKIPHIIPPIRMFLSCFTGLLISYFIGTIYMMFYLSLDFKEVIFISVIPYIPFDLIKIFIAIRTISLLEKRINFI